MLELIRRYRTLFSVFFVVACLGLVASMFGAPGAGSGMGGAGVGGEVVARVEGEPIQTRELLQLINQEMQRMEQIMASQKSQDPQQAEFMKQFMRSQLNPDQVLKGLIQRRFFLNTARQVGVRTPPESIRQYLAEIPDFQTDGRFDPALYRSKVSRPAMVEDNLRKELTIDAFRRNVTSSLSLLSTAELESEQWLAKKRVFETASLSAELLPLPPVPSATEVEAFLKEADSQAKLQAWFIRNNSRFNSPEQVHVRHILIPDDKGGENQAKVVLAEIQAKKISFEDAAKKHSTDASNSGKGGDLGFFAKGVMDPAFEAAAFGLKSPKQIAGPVKSSFGWHLIQFEERKAPIEKKLEDVKAEIASEVLREDLRKRSLDKLVAQWSALPKGPSDAQLKDAKLGAWQKQAAWTPTEDQLPGVGNVDAHLKEILALTTQAPFLKQPLPRGDSYVLLRFASFEEAKDEPVDEFGLAQKKAEEAFNFFLQSRFEGLEKNKKIETSESALAKIREAVNAQF
jgi:hypothetical protein